MNRLGVVAVLAISFVSPVAHSKEKLVLSLQPASITGMKFKKPPKLNSSIPLEDVCVNWLQVRFDDQECRLATLPTSKG
jgi:hypothetical protein